MNTLLVDAGNSSLKWAVLSQEGLLSSQEKVFYTDKAPLQCFQNLLNEHSQKCDSLLLVSVLNSDFTKNAKVLTKNSPMTFRSIRSQKTLAGVKNAYIEPHKLGADRFVAMIAAHHLSNQQNKSQNSEEACIVIDAGTATTIDAIDKNGQHLGGLILPGTQLCRSSLLENTALLPLWNKKGEIFLPELFSKETSQAIASASIIGLAGAIENICSKMANELLDDSSQPTKRILCGGDAEAIIPFMESNYEYHKDLLMFGLKTIAQSKAYLEK